jgi:hypothetical protein
VTRPAKLTTKLGNDPESPSPSTSAAGSQTELISHVPHELSPVNDGHVPLEATIGESDPDRVPVPEPVTESNFALNTNPVHDSITRAVAVRLPWKIVPFVIGVFIIVEVRPFTETSAITRSLTASLHQGLYDAGWTNLIATGLRHAVTHDNDK